MDAIKIIIVDDHPAIRLGLQEILNQLDDMTVVGVAENGKTALDLCQQDVPDVALIDLFMPGMDGIETIQAIQRAYPAISVIVLTHSARDDDVIRAIDAGATGYLVKDAEISEIAGAIRAAVAGRRALSPDALEALIRARTTPPYPDEELSDREQQVLLLMARGMKNPQIAEQLNIALSTVKFHISTIFKKLKVKSRTEAVVRAIEAGLIDG